MNGLAWLLSPSPPQAAQPLLPTHLLHNLLLWTIIGIAIWKVGRWTAGAHLTTPPHTPSRGPGVGMRCAQPEEGMHARYARVGMHGWVGGDSCVGGRGAG